MAHEQGWLAEHMLILKLTAPSGEVHYVAGAFPSACGKTNLAMLVPTVPGWTVETIGDDIAWMQLRRRRPPVGDQSRGRLLRRRARHRLSARIRTRWPRSAGNTVFTNTALTPDGDIVVGGHDARAAAAADRLARRALDARAAARRAAHPNARFTVPAAQCPSIAPEWEDPAGRARSRRSSSAAAAPPRCRSSTRRARGSTASSSARRWPRRRPPPRPGRSGKLRRDPFAMLPFCGYNMGDYFAHWLAIGAARRPRQAAAHLPGQLVPQGRRTAATCGPASARTAACWRGSPSAARARRTPSRRRSASSPPPARCPSTDLALAAADLEALLAVDVAGWRGRAAAAGRAFRDLRRPPAARARTRSSRICAPVCGAPSGC